jgi:phosphoglycolate phosphatase-like HAD superfamily hydrolase
MYNNYSTFIFDLDNTLYDEIDYLFQGYKKISEYVEVRYKISSVIVEKFMILEFINNGRQNLFDVVLRHFNLPKHEIENFLQIIRTISIFPKIKLRKTYYTYLKKLNSYNKNLFILTNGNPLQQSNKIKCIDWEGIDKYIKVYFANLYEPKPSAKSLEALIKENNIEKKFCLMIGDQITDKECAFNANIDFLFDRDFSI